MGKPTERGYHYLKNEPEAASSNSSNSSSGDEEERPLWRINTLASHPESGLVGGWPGGRGAAHRRHRPGALLPDCSLLHHTTPLGSAGARTCGKAADLLTCPRPARPVQDMGVQTADGDGTVPLISLGLMCHKGWRSAALNPGGMRVVTREFKHQPVSVYRDVRGGPSTADHVDILGNTALLADLLHIAAGATGELQDEVHSDIARIAAAVPLWQ